MAIHNLPLQLTSFVGRERERGAITDLLANARLLTLTGAGGVGKTRLALRVARSLADSYPDGVWFVELAPLSATAHIPQAIASTMGIPEQAGQPLLDTLLDALRLKDMALFLDNCEHLLPDCAGITATLLRVCPTLRILATSREPLDIPGETIWRVAPLSLPDSIAGVTPDTVSDYEATRLFLERARASQPDFVPSARLPGHRRHLPAAGRHPAGHRACRGADPAPPSRGDRPPSRGQLPTPDQRRPRHAHAAAQPARRSSGAITCSASQSGLSSTASPSFVAAGRLKPPKRLSQAMASSQAMCSIFSSGSWTSHWSSATSATMACRATTNSKHCASMAGSA